MPIRQRIPKTRVAWVALSCVNQITKIKVILACPSRTLDFPLDSPVPPGSSSLVVNDQPRMLGLFASALLCQRHQQGGIRTDVGRSVARSDAIGRFQHQHCCQYNLFHFSQIKRMSLSIIYLAMGHRPLVGIYCLRRLRSTPPSQVK